MKRASILAAFVIVVAPAAAFAQSVYHQGYTTRNGTYVPPHYQSAPDSSYNNNWSVSPNTNPYTGQSGTHSPTWNDRTPSFNQQNFGSPGYVSPYGSTGGRRY
jgi:opacity protein-like surface antigen